MFLSNISLFLTIVEKGSLAAAAREAGLSPTTVSERLAALEAHFGVVLLNRTTRAISLTDEGRLLVEGARQILSEVENLEARIKLGAEALSGSIRVSAPVDLGESFLVPEINQFLAEHSAVSIDLVLTDSYVDIVGEGIDIALRFGEVADSSMRVRSLGKKQRSVCASPEYLGKNGTPKEPADLKKHNCLVMRFGPNLDNIWRFGKGPTQQIITVKGNRIANNGSIIRQWGIAGYGIILKSEFDVSRDIREGRLVRILSDYAPPPIPLQMLFPPSRAQPQRVRAFADQLVLASRSLGLG